MPRGIPTRSRPTCTWPDPRGGGTPPGRATDGGRSGTVWPDLRTAVPAVGRRDHRLEGALASAPGALPLLAGRPVVTEPPAAIALALTLLTLGGCLPALWGLLGDPLGGRRGGVVLGEVSPEDHGAERPSREGRHGPAASHRV